MIKVKLEKADGGILAEFDFPTEAREVTYRQFIRFETAYQAKERWLEENKDASVTDPKFAAEYIRHVAKVVEAFTGIDNILEAKLGDYMAHMQQVLSGDPKAIATGLQEVEGTVFTLYANIWRTIANYRSHNHTQDRYWFEYKGRTYFLQSTYRDAVTKQIRFQSLSVAQAIEALEAWRVYDQAKAQDDGNKFLFTTILTLIACLALEDGQSFPDTESEIQRWVSSRVDHFQDVNMEIALNVRDFFLSTTNRSGIILPSAGSSPPRLIHMPGRANPGKNGKRRTLRPPLA